MDEQRWAAEGIDTERASAARVYDYYLGGAHNFAVDREMAQQVLAIYPETPLIAQTNRAFLRRAVRFLVNAGIRQFLDIGSGIPTVGHVHEIAQAAAPDARVVYVDLDPVAVAHSRQILADNDRATVIQADLRQPDLLLDHLDVRRMLRLDRPVAVLMVAVLHFLPDSDDPAGIIGYLRDRLAPGSFIVVGHGTDEGLPDMQKAREIYERSSIQLTLRSRSQVEDLFAGFELVEPGVVWVPQWRPDHPDEVGDRPELSANYGGVGRKP